MNVLKKNATIVRIKSMVDGSYRVEIDLGELTGNQLGELENLRKEGVIELLLSSVGALDSVTNAETH